MVRALTLTALSLSLRAPCCCTRWRARERVECEDARRGTYHVHYDYPDCRGVRVCFLFSSLAAYAQDNKSTDTLGLRRRQKEVR